jgi:hypothetical protein
LEQAFVVVLFVFTMDDTMYPRHHVGGDLGLHAPLTETGTVLGGSINPQKATDCKKSETLDHQVSHRNGEVLEQPRTYIEMLSPIHRFKEDKTTFWQYFKRPFALLFFPNIILVSICVIYTMSSMLTILVRYHVRIWLYIWYRIVQHYFRDNE